ncbi:hypothetical protein KJ830_04085 [bacterium]|nr:hypothetical protein [bacterium]
MASLNMTPEQFGNNLALSFQKSNIVPLINEYIKTVEENDKSWEFTKVNWKFNLGVKKDKKIILKEWIVFEMFLLRQQILRYFKGNQTGNNIVRAFTRLCADSLIEYNIFNVNDDFEDLLSSRYTYYLNAVKDLDPDCILSFSRSITDQLCKGQGNILYNTLIVKYYFDTSDKYRKLINGLMKDVILVEQTNNDQPPFSKKKRGEK